MNSGRTSATARARWLGSAKCPSVASTHHQKNRPFHLADCVVYSEEELSAGIDIFPFIIVSWQSANVAVCSIKTVIGSDTQEVKRKVISILKILRDSKTPLGAVGIYSYSQKIKVGLQQLMAGSRCFNIPAISRKELMSLIEECSKVTGIPYVMDAYKEEALAVLDS